MCVGRHLAVTLFTDALFTVPSRSRDEINTSMASARTNAAVLLAMIAWLVHRIRQVGFTAALAEAAGFGEAYENYMHQYVPLFPELFALPLDGWLDDSLNEVLKLHNNTYRSAALMNLVENHGHGVFSLPFLKPDIARRLAQECAHHRVSGQSTSPNSMNELGVVLGPGGLEGLDELLLKPLRSEVLSPLSATLYQEGSRRSSLLGAATPAEEAAAAAAAEHCCSDHHAFVVGYNATTQAGLDMHHDASDVTLNVCLEIDEQLRPRDGGSVQMTVSAEAAALEQETSISSPSAASSTSHSQLQFCGFVGDAAHRRRTVALRHAVGRAVIHLGAHRHGASDVVAGTRHNLILWGRVKSHEGEGVRRAGVAYSRPMRLHPHEQPPHTDCLSWTHDSDFEQFRELPPAAKAAREKRLVEAELMDLASRATEEHIAQLPTDHQPIVRMLRRAALVQRQAEIDEQQQQQQQQQQQNEVVSLSAGLPQTREGFEAVD